jgi:KinB signaling pathway activation protein
MTLAKWFFLFMTTVAWGIGVALVVGMFVLFIDPDYTPFKIGLEGLGFNVLGTALVGATLGAFSHMGFFAYLTAHFFAQGFFRSKLLWVYVQIFITAGVIFYTFRYIVMHVPEGENILPYIAFPILLIIAAIPITHFKVKQTNQSSIVPTLFFLIAVTLLEAVPALRESNPNTTALMLFPFFVCNAWQILQLHRLLGTKNDTKSAGSKELAR